MAGVEVIPGCCLQPHGRGDETGPTLCFRGLDNAIFYTLADDKRYYKDFTGNRQYHHANHPVVREHILAALPLLDGGNACGWVPVRPGLGAWPG